MKPFEVKVITDGGLWAEHNMPCPIYRNESAILNLHRGVFEVSRKASLEGYVIAKCDTWFKRFIFNVFLARDYWERL